MYKINLSKRKIQSIKTIKKNISKIIQKEYRKNYFYSIKYYYISKINPLISLKSDLKSFIKSRFKELQYEHDEKDYIIPISYKLPIIRAIIKLNILNNPHNYLKNIFPSYVLFEKDYFNILQNNIKAKRDIYHNNDNYKNNKTNGLYNNNIIKYNENSIINLINDDTDNRDESKDKQYYDENEEENKENSSIKSLLILTKKILKSKKENKYNKIKELFLENKTNNYNNNNINEIHFNSEKKKKLSFRKRTILPGLTTFFNKRISLYKTDKNVLKYFKQQSSQYYEEGKYRIKNLKKNSKLKILQPKNKNKFKATSCFKKDKNIKIKNIWNNCNINIQYDNNNYNENDVQNNKIFILGNNINILCMEDYNKLKRKNCSTKCEKELTYDKLVHSGEISESRKIVKKNMINQILKLTSRNLFNLNLLSFTDKNNKTKDTHTNNYNRNCKFRSLTKSLSYRSTIKSNLNDNISLEKYKNISTIL